MATLGSYDIQLREKGWFDAFLYEPAWFDEDAEFGGAVSLLPDVIVATLDYLGSERTVGSLMLERSLENLMLERTVEKL